MSMEQTHIPQLEKYEKFLFRRRLALIIAAIATVVAALCSAGAGTLHFPFSEILRTLLGKGTPQANTVLFGIRLPRIAAGLLVGGLLASSGAVMQCVLRNPLASASTLGVSQGAAFGAAIGIIVFGGGAVNSPSAAAAVTVSNPFTVTLCAFLFGSMSTFVVIAISRFKKSIGPGGLVLAGTSAPCSPGAAPCCNTSPTKPNWAPSCSGPSAIWAAAAGGRSASSPPYLLRPCCSSC